MRVEVTGTGDLDDMPERPEVTFGQRLRKLRTVLEWTQTEVAARVSALGYQQLHQTAIAKIEAGTRPLRLNEAVDIATVFNVSFFDFFYDTAEDLSGNVLDLPARITHLENMLAVTDQEVEAARLDERAALRKRAMFLAELEAARRQFSSAGEQPGKGG